MPPWCTMTHGIALGHCQGIATTMPWHAMTRHGNTMMVHGKDTVALDHAMVTLGNAVALHEQVKITEIQLTTAVCGIIRRKQQQQPCPCSHYVFRTYARIHVSMLHHSFSSSVDMTESCHI